MIFRIKGLDEPNVAVSLGPEERLRSPRFVACGGREVEAERGFCVTCRFV